LTNLVFALLLLSGAALGQAHTTVSGVVRDSVGNTYTNCTYNVNFIGQSTEPGPYLFQGSVFQQNFAGIRCDGMGNFSIRLPANNAIFPQPSGWAFHFCDQSGRYCNSLNSLVLTIAGSTQDISTQITAVMPTLAGGAGGWNPPLAPGGTIFGNNTLSQTIPHFFTPGGDVSFSSGNFWVNSLHFGTNNLFLQNTGLLQGNCLQVSGTNIVGGTCGVPGVTSFAGRTGPVIPQASDYAEFFAPVGAAAVHSVFGRTGDITAQAGDYTVSQITGAAPLVGPAFTGVPTAPTAGAGTNTTQLATTAFVIANRGALLASPAFTGTPTAPTAPLGTNTTQLATTAFVLANQSPGGVTSFNTRTGAITPEASDYSTFFAPISINGTLTNLSVSGLSPLFTTNVATATTTPSVTFTMTQAPAGTMLGNSGSTAATPNWISIPQSGVTSVFTRTGQVAAQSGDYAAFYPPINNAHLTGTPTAPTVGTGDSSTSIATTAWVRAQGFTTPTGGGNATGLIFPGTPETIIPIGTPAPTAGQVLTFNGTSIVGGSPSAVPVSSVFGRTGGITANSADYASYYLPITNAAMLGNPTAPTPATADNSTSIATTAWVMSKNFGTGNVASVFGRSGSVTADAADYAAFYAPITSPNFLGTPTAPTAATTANSTQLATTAFVKSLGYAPLASPTFTGTPNVPAPAITDAPSQRIANTNYVQQYVAANRGIGGTGTAGIIPIFTAASTLGNSHLDDDGAMLTYGGTDGISVGGGVSTATLRPWPAGAAGVNTTTPPAADNSTLIATTAWVRTSAFTSPAFTGTPTAPTAPTTTNTTQLATTAFVRAQLASPPFTGTPTAPTAAPGTNTTQLATTAFVMANRGVTGTGSNGFIPKFTAPNPSSTLAISQLDDDGTYLTYGGTGGIISAGPVMTPSIQSSTGTSTTTIDPPLDDRSNKVPTTNWVRDQIAPPIPIPLVPSQPMMCAETPSGGATSIVFPFHAAAGDTIVIFTATNAATIFIPSDTAGNIYEGVMLSLGAITNNPTRQVFYSDPPGSAQPTNSVTVVGASQGTITGAACVVSYQGVSAIGNWHDVNPTTSSTTASLGVTLQEPTNVMLGMFSSRAQIGAGATMSPGTQLGTGAITGGSNPLSFRMCGYTATAAGAATCGLGNLGASMQVATNAVELRSNAVIRPPAALPRLVAFRKLVVYEPGLPVSDICAITYCQEGLYRISVSFHATHYGNCVGGTIMPKVTYTDDETTRTVNLFSSPLDITSNTLNKDQSQYVFSVNGTVPVRFSVTSTPCTNTTQNPLANTYGFMSLERLF
jgi:hypothetical protein